MRRNHLAYAATQGIKLCFENKEEFLELAVQEMRLLTEISDEPVLRMFDKAFHQFNILTD